MLRFKWDPRKDAANRRKHGVAFEEAKSVFYDDNALLLEDVEHSHDEDRFVLLGMSGKLRILVVCHCYRDADDVIRIPQVPEFLQPIVSVVPLQLLSYHIAVLRGCDVDKPRNLAKSVTVE